MPKQQLSVRSFLCTFFVMLFFEGPRKKGKYKSCVGSKTFIVFIVVVFVVVHWTTLEVLYSDVWEQKWNWSIFTVIGKAREAVEFEKCSFLTIVDQWVKKIVLKKRMENNDFYESDIDWHVHYCLVCSILTLMWILDLRNNLKSQISIN